MTVHLAIANGLGGGYRAASVLSGSGMMGWRLLTLGAFRNCTFLIVQLGRSVIPVQTGIQMYGCCMDSHRRGNNADRRKSGMRASRLNRAVPPATAIRNTPIRFVT